jgi:hypothetical protein
MYLKYLSFGTATQARDDALTFGYNTFFLLLI